MNNIINKFLLIADRFMLEAHLKDLKVGIYGACGSFTGHKDRINTFFQTGDANYIYKNELDKVKNRTAAYRISRDKAYVIAKDPKNYGTQRGLASMFYKFFA